jgi:hypothetical protein
MLDSKLLDIINDSKLSGTDETVDVIDTLAVESNIESIDDVFDWFLL